jgi:hypothetical protein
MRIRVMHPGDTGYSDYTVDAIEIHDPVVLHTLYFGTMVMLDAELPAERQEELKEGLPK